MSAHPTAASDSLRLSDLRDPIDWPACGDSTARLVPLGIYSDTAPPALWQAPGVAAQAGAPAENPAQNPAEHPALKIALGAALTALAWSTATGPEYGEDGPECLDGTGLEWSDEAREALRGALAGFLELCEPADVALVTPAQLGHDFILTANGHGAGFWDRGLGEAGERLSAAARTFGTIEAWAADGALHVEI